jgi:hypothetical protein
LQKLRDDRTKAKITSCKSLAFAARTLKHLTINALQEDEGGPKNIFPFCLALHPEKGKTKGWKPEKQTSFAREALK